MGIDKCVTHHHACDCREEYFKKVEEQNKALTRLLGEVNCPRCNNTIKVVVVKQDSDWTQSAWELCKWCAERKKLLGEEIGR